MPAASDVLRKAWEHKGYPKSGLSINLNPLSQTFDTSGLWIDTVAVEIIPLMDRAVIEIFNNSTTVAYLGPSGMTSGTGRPLYEDSSWSLDLASGNSIYALTATGSADLRITELG